MTSISLKTTLSNLFVKVIKVAPPGREGEGPWSDKDIESPVPARRLEIKKLTHKGIHVVHVMTIGRPIPGAEPEMRRIKVYEHVLELKDIPADIAKKLKNNPEEGLMLVDPILCNPQTKTKLSDKVMTREAAVRALASVQLSLLPLYGGWLKMGMSAADEKDIVASTVCIYLCGHCPDHGTVARVVKPLEENASKTEVREHLATMLSTVLDVYWNNHPHTGWAMAVVVPPGTDGTNLYF